MSSGLFLFCLIEFGIGALAGMSASRQSPARGCAIAILLAMGGIIELIAINIQKMDRHEMNFFWGIISALVLGSVVWGIALLSACTGYWLAYWASGRRSARRWQLGIPTLLVLFAFYAVVAAIGRMT